MKHKHRVAIVLFVLVLGLFSVGGQLVTGMTGDDWLFTPVAIALTGVGAVLALRVPENRVSWLMLTLGSSLLTMGVVEILLPDGANAITGIILFTVFLPGLAVFLPLWFPTGKPPSSGWNWVAWAGLGGLGLIITGFALVFWVEGGNAVSIDGCSSSGTCASTIGLIVLLVSSVGAIASLVVRWRRSSGTERMQLRWLVPSFVVLGIGFLAEFGGLQDTGIALVFGTAGMLLVPLSVGFSVTRYRLYDIDRIVSRTVSYALVAGVLGLVFFGLVTIVGAVLPGENPLAVAASTLAVAALFNPVRRRIQGWVDRRFNRSRYDAERVMGEFAASLQDRVDPDGLVDGWVGVVSETMQPSSLGVWVREDPASS